MISPSRPPHLRPPVDYVLVALAVSGSAVWLTVMTIDHSRQPVYAIPGVAVAVAVTAGALTVAGAAGMVVVRRHDAALLTASVALLIAVGALALFSIGVLFLLAGIGIAAGLVRRWSGAGVRSVASGLAIAIGLGATALVAVQPPVVTCSANGVRVSSAIWSSSGSSFGSSDSGPGGVSNGTVSQGGKTFRYTCADGRLVEFRSVN